MKLKKMLAAVLTMAMVATALPVTALADEPNVAEVNGTGYATLAAAANEATSGNEIILLDDVTEDVTLPAGVIFNGNGKTVTGTISASGDLTFAGETEVTGFSAGYYNNTITIGEGASLKVTGGRITVSYGNIFNITGNISNAKTAVKSTITPSLELVKGISMTGDGGGVQFNVTNAYVKLYETTSKTGTATGEFNMSFDNSIVEFTNVLKTYVPTADGLDPAFNINVEDSVVDFASHLELWNAKTNLTIDNSDLTVGGSFANAGTVNVKDGADFVVKAPIMSSHGGNTGMINVESGSFELVKNTSEKWQNAGVIKVSTDATLIGHDFENVNEGTVKVVLSAGDTLDDIKNSVKIEDADFALAEVKVEGIDGAELEEENGELVLKMPVAMIGETSYYSLADAAKDIETDGSDTTIKILNNIEVPDSIVFTYGEGDIIFEADTPVTIKQTAAGKDFVFTDGKDMNIVVGENVTFEIYDNAGGMYVYYGPSVKVDGTITGGENWGCLYLFNGTHTVSKTGEISTGRVQLGYTELTAKGEIDTNYLLAEGSAFTADGATVDANVIYDNNNGAQRWGASTFDIKNGSEVTTSKLTLSYVDSVLTIDTSSTLKADKIVGEGQIVIDAEDYKAGDVWSIVGDASGFAGTIKVINNDTVSAFVDEDGNIVLKAIVAKVGDVPYYSLQDALKAISSGCVVEILNDVTITEDWDNRNTGAKITVPVTINGNNHTIKFTGKISDGYNYLSAFRFEEAAEVNDLTVDMSEAEAVFQNRFSAISTKAGDLTVDNCTFIGSLTYTNGRAIIFGEGAGDALPNVDVKITDSKFINWGYGVTDNMNGQDANSVSITENEFENANVNVSAAESVIFTGNEMDDSGVVITSYTENTTMDVTATGNTLDTDDGITNAIYKADGIVAQEGISTDRVAKIGDAQYKTLEDAIEAASAGDAIELMEDINDATLNGATVDLPAGGEVVVGEDGSYELPAGSKVTVGDKETTLSNGGSIAADGTVTATPVPSSGKGGGSSKPKYTATVDKDDIENGSVKLSSTRVKAGSTVTITVTPDEGYELDELKVLDKDGNEVELTDKGNGKFTFKMPKGGVEVDASFVPENGTDAPVVKEDSTLVLTIGQLNYQEDGTHKVNDVSPIIKGDRTMLPIRLIAEFLGATVTWNEAEQSVTIVEGDTTIVIYIGQAFALVNGEPVQLDAPAFIQNDRTYLPVRFIAENLGAEVIWDGVNQTVTVIG